MARWHVGTAVACLVVGSALTGIAIFLEERPVLPGGGVYADVAVFAPDLLLTDPDDFASEAQAVFHSDQVTQDVVALHGGDPDALIGERVALIPEQGRPGFRVVARAADETEAIALANDTVTAFMRAASDPGGLNLGDPVMVSKPREVPVPGETTRGDPPLVPSMVALALLIAGSELYLRARTRRNQELPAS
jgi:hypothetical protein